MEGCNLALTHRFYSIFTKPEAPKMTIVNIQHCVMENDSFPIPPGSNGKPRTTITFYIRTLEFTF